MAVLSFQLRGIVCTSCTTDCHWLLRLFSKGVQLLALESLILQPTNQNESQCSAMLGIEFFMLFEPKVKVFFSLIDNPVVWVNF